MTLCASCGLSLSEGQELCPHHHCVYGDDWAAGNRIMCDFFHRGIVPARVYEENHVGEQDATPPVFDYTGGACE